jgi:3-oxoacyl-[acyl-carrier protein] reductase
MSARFSGKVAVVAGASRGIGLGIAEQLGLGGARVVVNARKQEELDEAVASLVEQGIEARSVAGSAADEDVAARLVAEAVDTWGRIDYVVNNVGINPYYGPLREADRERFVKTMTVNTWTTIGLVQAALRRGLADDGGGSVVSVTTSGTRNASTVVAAYVASKAALNSVCKSLARELGPLGVRVNVVGPGLVRTHTARVLWEGGRGETHASLVPMGRIGEPTDIGRAVAFLLSDEASWITGTVLDVDGGFLLIGGDPEVIDTLTIDKEGK